MQIFWMNFHYLFSFLDTAKVLFLIIIDALLVSQIAWTKDNILIPIIEVIVYIFDLNESP